MLLLIAALVCLSISLLSFELLRSRPQSLRYRIAPNGAEVPDLTASDRTAGSIGQRLIGPAVRRVGTGIGRLLPTNLLRSITRLLIAADEPWSLAGFLAAWLTSATVGALLWVYIGVSNASLSGLQIAVIGMAIMPFAVLVPYAAVRSKARRRQKSIILALPDAMDLLVTSVEAGMGVDSAFALVTDKTTGPLSEAFSSYLKEAGLGRPRREALVAVAERTGVPDLIEIANSVNQGEQIGTSIGDVLRAQAGDLRARRRERAQMRAQRAPVLMTIPLALCFLPAMVAVVIVPSILNLLDYVEGLGS